MSNGNRRQQLPAQMGETEVSAVGRAAGTGSRVWEVVRCGRWTINYRNSHITAHCMDSIFNFSRINDWQVPAGNSTQPFNLSRINDWQVPVGRSQYSVTVRMFRTVCRFSISRSGASAYQKDYRQQSAVNQTVHNPSTPPSTPPRRRDCGH